MRASSREEAAGDPVAEIEVAPFQGTAEEWNRMLAGFDGGTFCHLGEWRRIAEEVMGHRSHYLVAIDPDSRVRGLLPLARVRSRIFGDYLVSMPFLSYGGPVGTAAAREALTGAAVALARELGVDLLELRSRNPVPGGLRTSHRKITVLLDLPSTSEILWSEGLRSKVRSQVRRPMKEGMVPLIGADQLDPFYAVFSRTMRDLGTPVLPRIFFEKILTEFSSQVVFSSIRLGDKPVAAGCGFLWQNEFEITWAGALREFNRMSPNMLLYWSLMKNAIDKRARIFNFGRCSPGSGTHRFKRQWGGRDVPLEWAQWSPKGLPATPSPEAGKYRLAVSVWRRLPLGAANRLGPLLSRNLP
jgi:FemAB-related protein (PEP-CTERM system-associated)